MVGLSRFVFVRTASRGVAGGAVRCVHADSSASYIPEIRVRDKRETLHYFGVVLLCASVEVWIENYGFYTLCCQ